MAESGPDRGVVEELDDDFDIEPKVGDSFYEWDGWRSITITGIHGDVVEYIDYYNFGEEGIRRLGNYWMFVEHIIDGTLSRLLD